MLNSASLGVVGSAKFSRFFSRPCYDSYCFSNLPATISFLLSGKERSALPLDVFGDLPTRYDKVIFLFIDSFGWKFFERYADRSSFLKTVLEWGVVSKLTSQFPSTTAAHATCIHTGLEVGESGVYEWQYYEPLVDEIIAPLLFSYAGDKTARDTLKQTKLPPAAFYPRRTFYQALQEQGVAAHIFQYQAYTPSTFSDIVFRGASVHPYKNAQEAFTHLLELVANRTTVPTYYFLYFDRIDAMCHLYGPESKQADESIVALLTVLDQHFCSGSQREVGGGKTLLMMSADHGHMSVDPQTTFYLNRQITGIERYFRTNARNNPLVPAGSPRDMFLHLKEECMDEAIDVLRRHLPGRAEVHRTADLLEQGFFGLRKPSTVFLQRVGNVVLLPYQHETVWWYEEGRFDMHWAITVDSPPRKWRSLLLLQI
ncbi:MAG: alkaline phosphatase family protein [Ktedonobacteraceae bacterium]|nr:alkaline phosphatase family protein [Ktedonobacteraceae bacterium]